MKTRSNTIFLKRLQRLRVLLKEKKLSYCIVENPIDLYYLTGLKLSAGTLLVGNKTAQLFVDGRYIEIAQKSSPFPVDLMTEKSLKSFAKHKIGFDSGSTSYERFAALQKHLSLVPFPHLLETLRSIKDRTEIKALKESAKLLWKGFEHLQTHIKTGITEKALSLEFELFCKRNGAEGLAFEPIIAFGPNSAMPHHRSGETRLKRGDLILVDIGVIFHHYHSDMTRVLFWGKSNPLLKRLSAIVQESQRAALKKCRPGALIKEVDEAAREVMRRENMESHFIHNLGHGVGLEIHEFPRLRSRGEEKDLPLQSGMVITIEPGLYLPGVGGARHEDTILITKNGYENFYSED